MAFFSYNLLLILSCLLFQSAIVLSQANDENDENDESFYTVATSEFSWTALSSANIQMLWTVHGVLMLVAFVVLVPLATASSMLRNLLPAALWLRIHMVLAWIAFSLVIAGFAIAVFIIQMTGDFPHFDLSNPHRSFGLAILVLLIVHVMLAAYRPGSPSAPNSPSPPTSFSSLRERIYSESTVSVREADDEAIYSTTGMDGDASKTHSASNLSTRRKHSFYAPVEPTSVRRVWEVFHRISGFTVLGVAWWNCHLGLEQYVEAVGVPLYPNADTLLWVAVGVTSAVVLVLFYAQATAYRHGLQNDSAVVKA